MKEDIQIILNMHKEGKISEDQMVELLNELKAPSKTDQKQFDQHDNVFANIEGIIQGVSETVKKFIPDQDLRHNSQTMSKVDSTTEGFCNNDVVLSKVAFFNIQPESYFKNNSINASHLKEFMLKSSSEFSNCQANASHLSMVNLTESQLADSQFNASKLKNISFEKSNIHKAQLNASNLKNVQFENCQLNNIQFHKCNFVNVSIRNVKLKDMEISLEHFKNCEIDGNEQFLERLSSPTSTSS
jgi:uncharacterized protein YjbI with pentapeptide repeats